MASFDNIGIEQHSVGHFAISKIWNSDIWGYSSFLDKSIDARISGWITTCPFLKTIVGILWWVPFSTYPFSICTKTPLLILISD